MEFIVLPKHFYEQPTLQLAQSLIGKQLVKETSEGICAGYIVETEAYMGTLDQAAHSFIGKPTPRTEVMYKEPGLTYVYTMHTHVLFNVVCGEEGLPHAVLVRAIEPSVGIALMEERRPKARRPMDLTNGPGKLCKAMGITMQDYGHPLQQQPLYIAEGRLASAIESSKRIGIENSGPAKEYLWRFYERDSPFVSRAKKN